MVSKAVGMDGPLTDAAVERIIDAVGQRNLEIATKVVDAALPFVPVAGAAKDVFEAATGRNIVTGERLDTFDRAMAMVGVATLGGSSAIVKGASILSDAAKELRVAEGGAKDLKVAIGVIETKGVKESRDFAARMDVIRQGHTDDAIARAIPERIAAGRDAYKKSILTGAERILTRPEAVRTRLRTAEQAAEVGVRETRMLERDVGMVVTGFADDAYPTIGFYGRTFVTDERAILEMLGPSAMAGGDMRITREQAKAIAFQLGIKESQVLSGFRVRRVEGLSRRGAASPIVGSDQFLGAGLPGGHPEMTIDAISTRDGNGVTAFLNVFVGD